MSVNKHGRIDGINHDVCRPDSAQIEAYICEIAPGETRSFQAMCIDLAKQDGCSTTSKEFAFTALSNVVVAAQMALKSGADASRVTPFWRLVIQADVLSKRLGINSNWVKDMQNREAREAPRTQSA